MVLNTFKEIFILVLSLVFNNRMYRRDVENVSDKSRLKLDTVCIYKLLKSFEYPVVVFLIMYN